MKYIVILLSLLITTLPGCKKAPTHAPVNKNASPETVALLDFLYSIEGIYTLSGQHNFIGGASAFTEQVYDSLGKYPVVWGSDFSWCYEGDHPEKFQHCGPINLSNPPDSVYYVDLDMPTARKNLVEEVTRMHQKGHIITLMWHGCFPSDGDCCQGESIWAMENRPDPQTWKELVTEGTELNRDWKEDADKIAGYLKELQERHIPVLWRPYHEMNGVWFWWCNQQGEDGFKKLWIMMYDYFTEVHDLNNLIWVWNTNAPRDIPGDEAWDYELFWPGQQYVDVLAADVYRNDYRKSHHDDLLKLANGKPIALGEVGTIPEPAVLDQQPQWTWFMPWGWLLFRSADMEQIRQLYNDPRVLFLEDIQRNPDGHYEILTD